MFQYIVTHLQSMFRNDQSKSTEMNDRTLLLASIAKSDLDGVKACMKIYYCQDFEGAAAAAIAIDTLVDIEEKMKQTVWVTKLKARLLTQLEIYETLIASGLHLNPNEKNYKFSELSDETRRKLRDIHKFYIKAPSPTPKHITTLIEKSNLAHHTPGINKNHYGQLISNAYYELNAIEMIEPILRIAATTDKLSIIFDFSRDSIDLADPTTDPNTKGISYSGRSEIYIAAKGLMKTADRFRPLAVMAHEFSHLTMELIYQNNCKPYKSEEQEPALNFLQKLFNFFQSEPESKPESVEERFEEILGICEDKIARITPKCYISHVFLYPEEHRHQELIVRVPHVIALYKEDEESLKEVKEKFSELFEFYMTNTFKDIQRESPIFEARKCIKILNDKCGVVTTLIDSKVVFKNKALNFLFDKVKITMVSSKCPDLTLQSIYQQFSNEQAFESSFVFIKADNLKIVKIFELTIEASKLCTKPTIIIDCKGQNKVEISLITQKLSENGVEQNIVFIHDCHSLHIDPTIKNISRVKIKHCRSQLTPKTQSELSSTFHWFEMPINHVELFFKCLGVSLIILLSLLSFFLVDPVVIFSTCLCVVILLKFTKN